MAALTTGPSLAEVKLDLDGTEKADTQYAPKLRSSAGRAHILKESQVDVFGNSTSSISQGCVEGCSTPDETILSVTEAGRPQGDPTGWLWRPMASYIPVGVEKRHHTSTTFDDKGRLVSTKLYISGLLALDRFREEGPGGSTDVAPPPADSSEESGENGVVVSRVQYDAFGHTTLGRARTTGVARRGASAVR